MKVDLSASARRLAWFLAGAGLLFDIAAYYPGHMSFDSAYTWWQARVGESSDTQPALLPIVVFAMRRLLAHEDSGRARLRVAAASALVLAALFGAVQLINASVDRHLPAWPAVAVFDLAALSIATNQVLLPAQMIG